MNPRDGVYQEYRYDTIEHLFEEPLGTGLGCHIGCEWA